jgi:hypothetical protein
VRGNKLKIWDRYHGSQGKNRYGKRPPSVGLEKEVTKNVSLFVNRKLNEERGVYEQQAGIEYKFNKNFSVESQVGTRNSGADVLFQHDW